MAIVHLSGNVDVRTVPEARRHLLGELRHGGAALHIDMGEVDWIDSAGLAILVEVAQQARQEGRQVHLHRVGETVRKMMRLAHLDEVFSMCGGNGGATLH